MKKFYTLLAAAAVASSAMALTPKEFKNLQLATGFTDATLQKVQAPVNNNVPEGMQRILNTSDQTEWSQLITIVGELTLNNTDPATGEVTVIPFEEYPYYYMMTACQPRDTDDSLLSFIIAWPCYGALNDDCWDTEVQDGQVVQTRLNEEKCRQIYGDKAMKAMSYDDFVEEYGSTTLYMYPFFERRPQIAFNNATIQYKGAEVYPCFASINEGRYDVSTASSINWSAFDVELSESTMSYNIPYSASAPTADANGYPVNGTQAGIAAFQLKGTATALGFGNVAWDTIGQVHIFNAGRQTNDDMYGINYDEAFDPLNYYYLTMSDDAYGYQAWDGEKEIYGFGESELPVNSNNGIVGFPSYKYSDVADDNLAYFAGALWAPENAENPYGLWTMKESKVTTDDKGNITRYNMPPMAYNLVQYINYTCGTQDGFHGAYRGYQVSAMPGEAFIGIGDETRGVNISMGCNLTNGYSIVGSFKENITYHPTPNKWVSDIQELPACVPGLKYDAIGAASSVEAIESESNAPVVSKSFYNFQGQRLSSEPENGMYIIRTVKADGTVKSVKVAR